MNPGDTFFESGKEGHLWMVLTAEASDGTIALANLTTHDLNRRRLCSEQCMIVHPGEHPFVRRDSCVYLDGAYLGNAHWVQQGIDSGINHAWDPLTPQLLERIRREALASLLTPPEVREAIRRDRAP